MGCEVLKVRRRRNRNLPRSHLIVCTVFSLLSRVAPAPLRVRQGNNARVGDKNICSDLYFERARTALRRRVVTAQEIEQQRPRSVRRRPPALRWLHGHPQVVGGCGVDRRGRGLTVQEPRRQPQKNTQFVAFAPRGILLANEQIRKPRRGLASAAHVPGV